MAIPMPAPMGTSQARSYELFLWLLLCGIPSLEVANCSYGNPCGYSYEVFPTSDLAAIPMAIPMAISVAIPTPIGIVYS